MFRSIRFQLVFIIILLTTLILGGSSVLYYWQFETALNERILLHLTSIKRLKRLQIEDLLEETWQRTGETTLTNEHLLSGDLSEFAKDYPFVEQLSKEGIYDVTAAGDSSLLTLAFCKMVNDTPRVLVSHLPKIHYILLERTGMGRSGETYLVGEDRFLRSTSRFFKQNEAKSIEVNTLGVEESLKNSYGKGVYKDYRGEYVFGAYHFLNVRGLKWAILSEIDSDEVLAPLDVLLKNMLYIALASIAVGLVIAFGIGRHFTKPISRIKNTLVSLAQGEEVQNPKAASNQEFESINTAVDQLIVNTKKITAYAEEIGNMNLRATFTPRSKHDLLGIALLAMKDKLKQFRDKELSTSQKVKRALIEGQENERQRISKDLHDDIGPLLTSLKLYLSNNRTLEVDVAKGQIDNIIKQVRRLTNDLMPSILIDFGVASALQRFIDDVASYTDLKIDFVFENEEDVFLPKNVNIALYRVALEAINNVLKHANASKLRINITVFDNFVSMFMQDNGTGATLKPGNGIINMRERITSLEGDFKIEASSVGVKIEIEIPL